MIIDMERLKTCRIMDNLQTNARLQKLPIQNYKAKSFTLTDNRYIINKAVIKYVQKKIFEKELHFNLDGDDIKFILGRTPSKIFFRNYINISYSNKFIKRAEKYISGLIVNCQEKAKYILI
jgi:intergrase/recombinase